MLRPIAFLLLLGFGAGCQAEVLPLSALLENVSAAPAVRAVEAEMAALEAAKAQREAEAGWQWFASAGTGRYRELTTGDQRDDYHGRDLALGLRHPLLGTLRRQHDLVRGLESERQQQEARRHFELSQQQLALRSAYADWWRAQQEQRWCVAMAQVAISARQQLAERLRGGWILASDARLHDGRWATLQQRCATADLMLDETRFSLQTLSSQAVAATAQAQAEILAGSVQPLSVWMQALETHPRLQERRAQLRLADRNRQSPWYDGIDSDISIAQSYEDRAGSSKPGNGLVASISLSTPFDPLSYGTARGNEREARHQAALAQVDAERDQLTQGLAQALRAQRQAAEELTQARQQVEVATLAVREQQLRRSSDVDQAFLGALTAELEQGFAGLRLIAAWHGLWLRNAALRLFVDEDRDLSTMLGPVNLNWQAPSEAAAAPRVAQSSTPWRQGVYVWDSRKLLDAATRDEALLQLHRAGMRRIHLGVSGAQLAELEKLKGELRALLAQARESGMETTLLLGDPDWMLPGPRRHLIELIGDLADLPFATLHLDLEVEQLGWPVPQSRLQDWMDTLAEVTRVSPWPVELSSHHRWFAAPGTDDYCVPCALQERGVRQVSLMIYTRSPERSAELAEGIARRWPGLSFRLAQSVEPQLEPYETWSGVPHEQLQEQVEYWRQRLQPLSVTGIDWQEWSFYPR